MPGCRWRRSHPTSSTGCSARCSTYADESFNTILELGFSSAIRKEWEWRISRGESTRNLEAFRGWLEGGSGADSDPSGG